MIVHKDQMQLFTLISKRIKHDTKCWAFGGTAMMFYGYKNETKDIDLLFEDELSRTQFISAIKDLGFEEFSPITLYIPEKLRDKNKPLMFKNGSARFDLFFGKIFRTSLSEKMKEDKYAVHDFKGENLFRVHVLKTEHIVLLKSVTERDKDFEDILTIVRKDKYFDWQYLIDEAVWQHTHGDSWVLLDVEKMLQELKKYVFVEEKYFEQIYAAQGKKNTTKRKKA